MGIIHKDLLICVLCNDSANSSDCLMANMWLMSDELRGEGNIMTVFFRLDTSQKVECSFPDGVFGIVH